MAETANNHTAQHLIMCHVIRRFDFIETPGHCDRLANRRQKFQVGSQYSYAEAPATTIREIPSHGDLTGSERLVKISGFHT